MVDIAHRLMVLFPGITFGAWSYDKADCIINSAGEIIEWNRAETKPTKQELLAVTKEQIDAVTFNNNIGHYTYSVQKHLDKLAQSWGYDNIISLCSYAGNSHPKYSAEGAAGLSWRSAVWDHCEKELAKIMAETRGEPESVESFITELPVVVRPKI